ncbi:unnamed protein product [Mycena citricolor]|uniref:FAD-binding PCMH-type domain-containing protein n=1 Tax=Mycena citricolor TaxID=2018698 RepID=A0AAD2H091_9AGAR|nr:unnamed protein product [Mycena citricolor]
MSHYALQDVLPATNYLVHGLALDGLNASVDGRLHSARPFAWPCFNGGADCPVVQAQYTNETFRAAAFAGYINTQWETCQATGAQCLLDFANATSLEPALGGAQSCGQGSVSEFYIDVATWMDVAHAFGFSRQMGMPLAVKNTGHDYNGRSSAPGSLAVWMHHLKNITYEPNFVPQGCPSTQAPQMGVTLGAGVQWAEAYAFADAHNITLVGGSDRSVGVVGGWTQGGGHSVLSNTMGLGADRVLEYQVVTPDGRLRTVNQCQHEDLFFALRGGGGGTFAVVMSATILASPPVTLQALILTWPESDRTLTREIWALMVDNALHLASDGWGGFATANTVILVNPALDAAAANRSLAPLIHFERTGAQRTVTAFPTFYSFFESFTTAHVAIVGQQLALASRLVPTSAFASAASRSALLAALVATDDAAPGTIVLLAPPFNVPGSGTSATPLWRDSVYHVTAVAGWAWNATREEKRAAYDRVGRAMDRIRAVTPGGGAYLNEADVYEPDHEVSFWGGHYPELLRIKEKYDPDRLLDCWHCVGSDPESDRFSCYL